MTTLRRMTEDEYAAWVDATVPAYAEDKVASGQWAQAESLARSRKELDELLPQGLATPANRFFTIVDAQGAPVGRLWIAEQIRGDARIAYVYDIGIHPERQREGHARRALLALEDEARRLGLAGIALHVFGHNTGARALYATLGFEPTNLHLFKPLAHAAAGPAG